MFTLCPCYWVSIPSLLEEKTNLSNMIIQIIFILFHTNQTLTYAGNALHRDLPYALFEAGQAWVNLPDLDLFPLYQLLNNLL